MHNDFTYRQSELPSMTDEIKSKISAINSNVSEFLRQIQGNYRALFELYETLSDLLDSCDLNLQHIRIIPDGDGSEPVQRAHGLTDLPALEKQVLVSTSLTSTVAIKVLAGIFGCDFEQAAFHLRALAQAEFGAMSPEQIETAVAKLAKTLCENPDGGVFEVEVKV